MIKLTCIVCGNSPMTVHENIAEKMNVKEFKCVRCKSKENVQTVNNN